MNRHERRSQRHVNHGRMPQASTKPAAGRLDLTASGRAVLGRTVMALFQERGAAMCARIVVQQR